MTPWSRRIRAVLWTGIGLTIGVFPLARPRAALGQGGAVPGVNVDSLVAAAMAARPALVYTPTWRAQINGNVSWVEMKNGIDNKVTLRSGLSFVGGIRLNRRLYRLQDRSENQRSLTGTIVHRLSSGWDLRTSYRDSRQANRVIATGGRVTDFFLDTRSIESSARRRGRVRALRWDAGVAGSVTDGRFTFKSDATQWAMASAGARFDARPFDRPVSVSVRVARRAIREASRSILGVNVFDLSSFDDAPFGDLGGREDSLATVVRMVMRDSTVVTAEYSRFEGVRRYADQARSSLGSQIFEASALTWEREVRRNEAIRFGVTATPLPGVALSADAKHSVNGSDFAHEDTRFSETTTDAIAAEVRYRLPWGMDTSSKIEHELQFRDLGPRSVASFSERRRKFSFSGVQSLTSTMTLNVNYNTQLAQSFYVSPDNPRDRDQLDQSLTANLTGTVWSAMRAAMQFTWNETQFINIDASQSSNNRTKQRFSLGPRITFTLSDRTTVEQLYAVSVEKTEFHVAERRGDDTIDRNVDFTNTVRFRLTDRVSGTFEYSLNLHDRGAAVGPRGDVIRPDRTDRTDRMRMTMRWTMTKHLRLTMDYDYSRKEDRNAGGRAGRVTIDGGVLGGLEGNFNWGPNRTLRVALKKANRFSPFNTDLQNDFWVANSQVVYEF